MMESSIYSADFLIAALRSAEVGVWRFDTRTERITCDSLAEELLGVASPGTIDAVLLSAVPEDREAIKAFFQPSGRLTERAAIEFRIVRQNGEIRWLQCTGSALEDKDSAGISLGGIVRDITDRKEANLRLQESRRRLNALINNLPGMVYRSEVTIPWRLLFISNGVSQITGYDAAEFLRGERTWGMVVHPDDLSAVARQAEEAISKRQGYSLSYRILHRSGEVRWVYGRGEAVYDTQGQPMCLEGFLTDITELVRAEARLRQSKDLLEAIIEGIPDGVFLKDYNNEGRYVVINSALVRLMGRNAAGIVGYTDNELFPPELAAKYMEEDRLIVEDGLPSLTLELTTDTPYGQRLFEVRKFPILDDETRLCCVLGIVRDVTEQRALQDHVQQMQRMDAVGKLTGGVAHDFNNLLAIILGYGELLHDSIVDANLIGPVDKIIEATERGSELVRRLLAFARKQRLEPRVVNLNERLPGVVALLQRTLGENIRIEVNADPHLWEALVDPSQVDDAVVNLAINARDAMQGGGLITIETANVRLDSSSEGHLHDARPGDYVMLAVSDTGHGMTPEVLARVFEPFFTTKKQGQGTGLGLPMVYGFAKQSGGHVDIKSSPGHGTTVQLYLPRAVERAGASEDGASVQTVKGGYETILLVEDNDGVRAMAKLQLNKLGYHVLEAANAAEALALLNRGIAADLLFTDILMPGGMSGYELAEKVRRDRPGLRILFTTGYDSPATNRIPEEFSRIDLLHKPYHKHELASAIRRALDQGEVDGNG